MRLPVKSVLGLASLIFLGSGAGLAADRTKDDTPLPRTGPAADYPVVIGEPFTIGSTVWTPNDQLNYDAVGMATVSNASRAGVTGAHKTLPLPSYVEVTNLQTGRTILVRLEGRGPMVNSVLIELSRDAARQLGVSDQGTSPVRVRRVNPPERERAMLRQGGEAPLRMDTPPGLLQVLRRKLAEQSPLTPPPSVPPTPPKVTSEMIAKGPTAATSVPTPPESPQPAKPDATAATKPLLASQPVIHSVAKSDPDAARPASPAKSAPKAAANAEEPAQSAKFLVQVGAFSVEKNARELASKLDGFVEKPGTYWLVRIGPFETRAKAGTALEKAHKAGYTDARIQHRD